MGHGPHKKGLLMITDRDFQSHPRDMTGWFIFLQQVTILAKFDKFLAQNLP